MVQASRFVVDPIWRIAIKDLGLTEGEVLRRARLPLDLFSRPKNDISAEEYFRLWEGLETSLNTPCFSLELVKGISAEAFSPPIFASLCSPDLNTAMERLSHFKRLIGPMTLRVEKNQKQTSLTLDCLYTDLPLPESLALMELVFLTNLARMGTREFLVPLYISSKTGFSHVGRYAKYFGRVPVKAERYQLKFSAQDACLPFITENQAMWNFFEPELRKRLSQLEKQSSFARRVQSALCELLPSGRGSSDQVAQNLAVSKRSLQRYLKNEGTSFQKELNRTREKLARHYLANSSLPGSQISFLLGFDDPNSFVRAFRSWTGTTPEKIRAQGLI